MTDIELEEKIKEMREKAISAISPNLNEIYCRGRIESINSLLKDGLSRRLIKASEFDSFSKLDFFLATQGPPKGVYDHPALMDGTTFLFPKFDDSNFGNKLYYDEFRKVVGLLCSLEIDSEQKVLVYISPFYWSIKDFEGNWQKGEIIGEGMQGISQQIESVSRQELQEETSKMKIRKLCDLLGGKKLRVSMSRIYHHNEEGKLTSTMIHKYCLVE